MIPQSRPIVIPACKKMVNYLVFLAIFFIFGILEVGDDRNIPIPTCNAIFEVYFALL